MNEVDRDSLTAAVGILFGLVPVVLGSAVLLGLATRVFLWVAGLG
ncbi:hypothetical protein LCGC14_1807180 [marine sediment metagenome]|uniref:Uncharacterized protein n=1 Tax=marine sediment metagenome TaxID=412755 RepID=A0A0F9GMP2_9ZZZZ